MGKAEKRKDLLAKLDRYFSLKGPGQLHVFIPRPNFFAERAKTAELLEIYASRIDFIDGTDVAFLFTVAPVGSQAHRLAAGFNLDTGELTQLNAIDAGRTLRIIGETSAECAAQRTGVERLARQRIDEFLADLCAAVGIATVPSHGRN